MRCVALDDEPIALALTNNFIGRTMGLEPIASFTDPREALDFLSANACDLLFIDLHMPFLHGFNVLRALPHPPMAIITTAHEQHAAKSYDLDVVDYLLKPFSYERFRKAVDKARARERVSGTDGRAAEMITVRSGHETLRIPVENVAWLQGYDNYVKVHLVFGKPITALTTLKALCDQLPPDRFLRVHRSFVVALGRVTRLNGRTLTVAGQLIPIGRTYFSSVVPLIGA